MPEDGQVAEAANGDGKTLGDLVTALREALQDPEDLDLLGAEFWIDHVQREAGDEWKEAMQWPLTTKNVLALANPLIGVIQYEIGGRGDAKSYADARARGHAFLRLFHAKATELGVEVALEQIDPALTMTEVMEAAGMVEVTDGRVKLTDEGKAAAQEVQEAIDRQGDQGEE